MNQAIIIQKNKNLKKEISNTSWKSYFPQIVEDLEYIWYNFLPNLEVLTKDEWIENSYEIYKAMITYLIEIAKIYYEEKYQLNIEYKIDELKIVGGCAAYDEKTEKIYFSIMGMMLKSANISSYLQTIFHECRHVYQHQFYKSSFLEKETKFPTYFYKIAKHYIFEKEFEKEDENFYYINYNKIYPEVDAEETSLKELNEFLPYLYRCYQEEEKNGILSLKINSIHQRIVEDIEELTKELIGQERIYNQSSNELYRNTTIESTFLINGEERNSMLLIDEYIKKHPNILEKYPVLEWAKDEKMLKNRKVKTKI